MPEAAVENHQPKKPGRPFGTKKNHWVKVHWQNVHPENTNLMISVNPVGHGKKVFPPGTRIKLNNAQIDTLRYGAKESTRFTVDPSSSVYEQETTIGMKRKAEENFPGHTAEYKAVTGEIEMVRETPRFMVEFLPDED